MSSLATDFIVCAECFFFYVSWNLFSRTIQQDCATQTKAKAYDTYIVPQTATTAAAALLDRACVQPIGRRPAPTTSTCDKTAIHSPGLPFNPCNYIDYYSFTDPGGMEG